MLSYRVKFFYNEVWVFLAVVGTMPYMLRGQIGKRKIMVALLCWQTFK
jgi:hypothetical protein